MPPKPAAVARKPSSSASPKVAKSDGSKAPNFYNGPTEIATKKTTLRASGTPIAVSTIKTSRSSRPRASLRTLLLRLALGFTLASLLFCPPQLSPSTPAFCRPASTYHQTLQPYIQPHINTIRESSKQHLAPYYEPYRPYVEGLATQVGALVRQGSDAVAPHAALARSTIVRNYKRHLAPRLHYARIRASAFLKPHVDNVVVRYRVLVRPYIVRAQAAVRWYSSQVLEHPVTDIVKAKALRAAYLSKTHAKIAYRWAQPELLRLSSAASKHVAHAAAVGKKHAVIAGLHVSRVAKHSGLPLACKGYQKGKELGFNAGKGASRAAQRVINDVVRPQVGRLRTSFHEKVYVPYLAEYLEPLVQPARLIVKTSAHEALKLGRPVVRYSKLAVELTARYTMLVFNQVVFPAVSRTVNSINNRVYTPYLAEYLDPFVTPVMTGFSTASLHTEKVVKPLAAHATRLALPIWRSYFPAPNPEHQPTLLEKVKNSAEAVVEKAEAIFVSDEEAEDVESAKREPSLLEKVQETVEAVAEKVESVVTGATEEDKEDLYAEVADAAAEDDEEESVEETTASEPEPEDAAVDVVEGVEEPRPTPAVVVPAHVASAASVEQVPFKMEETAQDEADVDEALSTDSDESDDEEAEFLASLEASDDPVHVVVPEIEEPELPDLPGAHDTAAQIQEKDTQKLAAVRQMRAEIEKKQYDYEQKMKRVGELEEQKLINQLVDIRSRAVSSFPRLSEHLLLTVEKDANKAARSLEKYFKRPNLKWDDIESAIYKGRLRVDSKVDDAAERVNNWLAEVEQREEHAVTEATDKVDAVSAEAVQALGLAYAWLDDVTRHDWARYHGISKAGEEWHNKYAEHASSDRSSSALLSPDTDLDGLIESFREALDEVQDGFGARIGILKTNAMTKIDRDERKAQGLPEDEPDAPLVSIQPVWDAIAGGRAAGAGLIGKGKDQVLDALLQASEAAVGAATETSQAGIVAQVTSQAAALVDVASEAVIGTTSTTGPIDEATLAVESKLQEVVSQASTLGEGLSSAVHSATRAAASVIGATPSPESPAEHVQSVLAAVSEGAASVVEAASENLHEATRAASRAVGATPTPETVGETVAQAVEDVKSVVEEGYERVQDVFHRDEL